MNSKAMTRRAFFQVPLLPVPFGELRARVRAARRAGKPVQRPVSFVGLIWAWL